MSIPPLGVQTRVFGADPRCHQKCSMCNSGKMHYYMQGYDTIFTPCPNCVSTYRSKQLTDLRLQKLEEHTLQITEQIKALEKEIGEIIKINKNMTESYVKDIDNLKSQLKFQKNLININANQINEFLDAMNNFKDLFNRYYNIMIFVEKRFGLAVLSQETQIKFIQ